MDEAARCHRVGFMQPRQDHRRGQSRAAARTTLTGASWSCAGPPLPLLRRIAGQDAGVEDVRPFGDRLHLRLKEPLGQAVDDRHPVFDRLRAAAAQGGAEFGDVRPIPPSLEDVFIALSAIEFLPLPFTPGWTRRGRAGGRGIGSRRFMD